MLTWFPRYTPHPKGYQAAVRLSEDFAARARAEIDTDEPSVDALQALLLLVTAFTGAGKGKKAYMLLSMYMMISLLTELAWACLMTLMLILSSSKCRGHGHGTRDASRDGHARPCDTG